MPEYDCTSAAILLQITMGAVFWGHVQATHISKRSAVWITLGLLTIATAYIALRISGPYLESVLAGAVMATLFYPLHVRIQKHLKRPSMAALLSTLIVIITVVVPIAFAIMAIIRALRQGNAAGADEIWRTLDTFTARVGMEPGELRNVVETRFQEAVAPVLKGSISAATAAGGGLIQFVVAMGAFHLSLLHGSWLHEQTLLSSPLGRARTSTLLDTVEDMIRASFYGIVAVAAAQGTLLAIGAWIAGLPAPPLWGVVAMFTSVLPLIGSAFVWIPGAILLLAQGKIGMGLFFLAWSAGLVSNIDNLVRPLIVQAKLPVSGLVIFIAILGGIQAFGAIGLFVGPVTLAVGQALFRMLREEVQPLNE